eukprot:964717-Pyramimonas_sp.AAC.1
MNDAEKADLLRMRQVLPSGPPLSLSPPSHLLPRLVHVEGDDDDSDAPYLPDEDNRSVDAVGYPEPADMDMEFMEVTADADTEMTDDEYSHQFGSILTDEELEAQVQAAGRRPRASTSGPSDPSASSSWIPPAAPLSP